MDIIPLLVQLVSGALGGNAAGAALKNLSLGTLGNSLVGILGGGLGGTILQTLLGADAAPSGSMDIGSIVANIAGGGVGGAVLLAIIGAIKNMIGKK